MTVIRKKNLHIILYRVIFFFLNNVVYKINDAHKSMTTKQTNKIKEQKVG